MPPPGPGPSEQCVAFIDDTGTWLISPKGEASLAPEQLVFPLARKELRHGEMSIYMDEWALVDIAPGRSAARQASDTDFAARAAAATLAMLPAQVRDTEVLVVEAAVHRRNGREIPTPKLIPFTTDLGLSQPAEAKTLSFRAELDPAGKVDRFAFLQRQTGPWSSAAEQALRDGLRLDYVDNRRHRAIVYGLALLEEQGRLALEAPGFVTIPQCCCNGEFNCL